MKAMLVAVAALQQLQELFLFSSAKMVPGCFCCLTGCWQEPPFWILLIVVLLTAARPGSRGPSHRPSQEQAAGGGAMRQPQLGASGTFLGRAWGRARTWGMAVGNWRPALLQRGWGSGWWPQGIMKWGPGPRAGWGEPWGGAGRALRAALAFWCRHQLRAGALPATARAGRGPEDERACLLPAETSPECLLQVTNLKLNQIPDFNASARRGWLLESGFFSQIARDALEMLMSLGCSQTKLSSGQAVNKSAC